MGIPPKGPTKSYDKQMTEMLKQRIRRTFSNRKFMLERCLFVPRRSKLHQMNLSWTASTPDEVFNSTAFRFLSKDRDLGGYNRKLAAAKLKKYYRIVKLVCPKCGGGIRVYAASRDGMVEMSHTMKVMGEDDLRNAMLAMVFGLSQGMAEDIFSGGSGSGGHECPMRELMGADGRFQISIEEMIPWKPVWRMKS